MFAFAGGGGGIYVSEIVKGGAADKCGRLKRGDEIIAVNDISLKRATQVHYTRLEQIQYYIVLVTYKSSTNTVQYMSLSH